MSRIGKQPIPIPQGVTVTVGENNLVTVKGPKGELSRMIYADMKITQEEGVLLVVRPDDKAINRSMHGLTRTLIANMVKGVSEGYTKMLEVFGVGYRAAVEGRDLLLNVGLSYQARVTPRPGITFETGTDQTTRAIFIKISGIDKEKVGQTTAEIIALRKPDKYKGKGIKFFGEKLKLKAGKRGITGKK